MPVSKKLPSMGFVFLVAVVQLTSCGTHSGIVVVNPVEIDSTLVNPGRGFTSTGRSLNENIGNRLHPLCGIYQQRFFWDVLEPEE